MLCEHGSLYMMDEEGEYMYDALFALSNVSILFQKQARLLDGVYPDSATNMYHKLVFL